MRRGLKTVFGIGWLSVLFVACASQLLINEGPPFLVTPSSGKPLIEPWGYLQSAIDRDVHPGNDFFEFANGRWLQTTPLPEDRPGIGFSDTIRTRNQLRLKSIFSGLVRGSEALSETETKVRDLYLSYMAANQNTLPPIMLADLDRLRAVSNHEDVAKLMGDRAIGGDGPFQLQVRPDPFRSYGNILHLRHSGLTLLDRSLYLDAGDGSEPNRQDLLTFYTKMLELAGETEAARRAGRVVELEHEMASLHWTRADRRQVNLVNNHLAYQDLHTLAPGFPWDSFALAQGYDPAAPVIARELSAFPALAELYGETPIEVWRDYLIVTYLTRHIDVLGDEISAPSFELFGRALLGTGQRSSRENRAISFVNSQLDQAVGQIFVERFFPPRARLEMEQMFENIRFVMANRIAALDWMSPETKQAALLKLQRMTARIGYPDVWRDYSGLVIEPDDLIGNLQRVRAYIHSLNLAQLANPSFEGQWQQAPQSVNAYYNTQTNELVLPAGYIQSPLFDQNADPAINYGAIGSIIGHEIGHGFDDQGSRYDANGQLRNWWRAEDRRAFDEKTRRLIAQYNQYEGLPGLFVNGAQTVGENLGDLSGMEIALQAYLLALNGETPPVLDGYTGLQRFFLGRAQARRFKRTDEAMRRRLLTAPHAPMRFRVNGVVRNMDAWYEAFNVGPEHALYLPPDERVRIW